MTIFACNLLIAMDCEQLLEATIYSSCTCDIPCIRNCLLATAYLKSFTGDANFHFIGIIII